MLCIRRAVLALLCLTAYAARMGRGYALHTPRGVGAAMPDGIRRARDVPRNVFTLGAAIALRYAARCGAYLKFKFVADAEVMTFIGGIGNAGGISVK